MKKEGVKILIFKHLQNTDKHPTSHQIYKVIEKDKNITEKEFESALADLEDKGRISYVLSAGNKKHYDIKSHEHSHFICDNCGMVKDLFIHKGAMQMLIDHAQRSINSLGKITRANSSFQGICHDCKKKS